MAARAQRREYMQLLADCQRVYCEVRLLLVADVVAARMAEYSREQLPSLTRSGCSYLMQACSAPPVHLHWGTPLRQSPQTVASRFLTTPVSLSYASTMAKSGPSPTPRLHMSLDLLSEGQAPPHRSARWSISCMTTSFPSRTRMGQLSRC